MPRWTRSERGAPPALSGPVLLTFTAMTRFIGVPVSPVSGLCARTGTVVGAGVVGAGVVGAGVLDACVFGSGPFLPFIATASPAAPRPKATTSVTATSFALGVCSQCGILMARSLGAPLGAGDQMSDSLKRVALEAFAGGLASSIVTEEYRSVSD